MDGQDREITQRKDKEDFSVCDYTDSDEKDTSEKKGRKREKGSSKETK